MVKSEPASDIKRPKFIKPVKVLVVVAPYYKEIADDLVAGATAEISASGAEFEIVNVPGALEVPTAIGMASRLCDFDAYVALGCVIRGETSHYDIVAENSAKALSQLGLDGICIGNGILTVDSIEQAIERSDPKVKNKGKDVAKALISLLLIKQNYNSNK